MRIINTIPVRISSEDLYPVPLSIKPGYYYKVVRPLKGGEGRPHILALRDFNGDGRALEFAFYYKESCNRPLTMLMGYSARQDRVIVYEFVFKSDSRYDPVGPRQWLYGGIPFEKPTGKMHWRYTDSYNSGLQIELDFRYVPAAERFEGEERVVTDPGKPK